MRPPAVRLAGALALAALVAVAHAGLVLRQFPVFGTPAGLPLSSGDSSFYFATLVDSRPCLRDGHLWGYSPWHMAGYPTGLWTSFGRKAQELLGGLFPSASPVALTHAWFVGAALLTPLLLAAAAGLAGGGARGFLLALVLALISWHFGNVVTDVWTFGNVSFTPACALAVLFAALLDRALAGGAAATAGAALTAGAVLWMHPLGAVPLGVGGLAVVAVNRQALRRPAAWLQLAAVAAGGLALVSPWLADLYRFRSLRGAMAGDDLPLQGSAKHLLADLLTDRAYRHPFDRRELFHVLLVLGALGVVAREPHARRVARALFGAALALAGCAALLGYVPGLAQAQPYRFMVGCEMFLIVPATAGAGVLAGWLRAANPAGRAAVACVGIIFLPDLAAHVLDAVIRAPRRCLTPGQRECADWLGEPGRARGRVACDDQELGNLLPYLTGREVVGGGISVHAAMPHGHAAVGRGFAFGRPAGELTADDWADRAAAYNIAYLVASPGLSEQVARWPDTFRPAARFDDLTVFAVRQSAAARLWEGNYEGKVEAATNRIVVRGAARGRMVLCYHYLDTLAADGVRLAAVAVGDDPVPFLAVDNPDGLSEIVITNRY